MRQDQRLEGAGFIEEGERDLDQIYVTSYTYLLDGVLSVNKRPVWAIVIDLVSVLVGSCRWTA
jgi:hypothetical protein